MKAFVNKNACMYCATCGGICPEVFFADDDGTMWALDIELEGELLRLARHAEVVCPMSAITIEG